MQFFLILGLTFGRGDGILSIEVKKRITNEIANNLKNFKKSVDKHKQRCYNKYIIKKGKSKRLKGKKL